MKKSLFVLLLVTSMLQAQPKYAFVTAGFDVANAIQGSKPTNDKPALDGQIKIGAAYNNFECLVAYENFNAINFQQFGFAVNYVVYPFYKVDLAFGGEYQMIFRQANSSFLSYGVNLEPRYDITDKWTIGLQLNYKHRPDIEALYHTGKTEFRESVFFNLRYKIN